MGQAESVNIRAGSREIKVKNVKQRISKETMKSLEDEFDRLQEAKTITERVFLNEIIGQVMPVIIGNCVYRQFASPTTIENNSGVQQRPKPQNNALDAVPQYVMTFDDFCAFYVVFNEQKDEEMLQVVFEILKLSPDHYHNKSIEEQQDFALMSYDVRQIFTKLDLMWLARISNLSEKHGREFFLNTGLAPNIPITFEDFSRLYPKIKHMQLFSWIPNIVAGFKEENMNLEPENEVKGYERRLTIQQHERQRQAVTTPDQNDDSEGPEDQENEQNLKLTPMEVNNIQDFYDREIKNKPAQEVHTVFRRMFKDMKNSKLRKYIFAAVSQVIGLTFVYLAEIVLCICKRPPKTQHLKFLFNIFAKQSKMMRGKAIKDFIEIFKLPMQVFKLATFLSLEQYLEELEDVEIDLSPLLAARPMMIAMTAVTPETDEEERQAILSAMNGNKNLETFIYETLPEEQEYYVIDCEFWESWTKALAINQDGPYTIKKEHKDFIDNKSLMEEMHEFRMKDLTYKQDFVLLPKYVYYPLSKWYSCEKEITRTVIQYRRERPNPGQSNTMFSSQNSRRFLMSSQKFYNPNEGQFEEELIHKQGEFVYELEIYPLIFYLSVVTVKGVKPHQKAVVNGKVDFSYLRKVAKTDSLPFEELQVSRKTTLHQVLQIASRTFKENIKRGRLLIEEQIISGTSLFQTLEEFGLRHGQLIYAEYSNSSNEFPSDIAKEKTSSRKNSGTAGANGTYGSTVGLQNLGNTCYMNSALQILVNLKSLHEYFIQQEQHLKQTNIRNPLAFKGDLVHAFAALMKRVWSDTRPVVPRNFKYTLGRISEQFVGFDQQDAQEFLAFCIDGLHEELNLRMKKPYIQNPESKNRELNELGLEQWSNSLLRNWSIIYFLFYGQMRSTLSCRQCRTESITFDIFSNIPLSLPEPSQQTVSIIVYRVPNRVKDILMNKIVQDENGNVTLQGFQRLDSERDSESGFSLAGQTMSGGALQRMHSSQSGRDRQHLAQFAESYNYMNNDQPMRVMLKVDIDIKIGDLITKISQIRELNIEIPLIKSELVLYQVTAQNNLRGIMNPEMKLSQYNVQGMDLMATEILTRPGRESIRKFYMDNKIFLQNHPETVLRCLTYASEKGETIEGVMGYPVPQNMNTPAHKGMFNSQSQMPHHTGQLQRPVTGESEYDSSSYYSSQMSNIRSQIRPLRQKLDKYLVLGQVMQKAFNFNEIESRLELPKDIFVIGYHRRFIKRLDHPFQKYVPQLIANPLFFTIPTVPSGRRIYDEVWASAHVMLKPNSRFHRPMTRWWERKNWREIAQSGNGIYTPFVLKAVDRTGYACALCHWSKKCSGCILLPTDAPIFEEDLIKKCFIAIEWHSKQLAENYNSAANEVIEHASTKKKTFETVDQANYTTLDDCLTKFNKTEQLENETNCERCKTNQIHLKRMEFFIPPPVLIIQLKRFRLYGNQWRKLQNLVDFPIRNFNATQYCSDAKFLKDTLEIEPLYDLHGIVNHYGTLGFGHYVSFVRNQFDDKWYRYDDLSREEVSEDQLHKESAYLLFYVRKDLQEKSLSDIMPNLEQEFFAGKPVRINPNQEGFVVENPQKNGQRKVAVKFKNQPARQSIFIADLTPEEDKTEIDYNPAELKHMQKFGRAKVDQEIVLRRRIEEIEAKKTKGCCGMLGGKSKRNANEQDKIILQRSNSIKQSGVISQVKTNLGQNKNQYSQQENKSQQRVQIEEPDSSVQSSIAAPLMAGEKFNGRVPPIQVASPKQMASARHIAQKEQMLTAGVLGSDTEHPVQVRQVMQSQEGPFNAVPRPRFKINDGMGDQVESVMSHFSQSEINHDTEGAVNPTSIAALAANSTATVMNHKPAGVKVSQTGRNGQHSSQLEQRVRGPSLTQKL